MPPIAGSAHSLGAIVGCLVSIPSLARLGRRGAALYVMSLAYIIGDHHQHDRKCVLEPDCDIFTGFLLIGLSTFPWLIITGR